MSIELWIAIIGSITTIVGPIITWFLAKRKYYTEIDHNVIQNMEHSLEFYKNLSDDNRSRLEELTERNNALEAEVQELRRQVFNLTMNICLDLTCRNRIRENKKKKSNGKAKDRLDQTENTSSRGCEPTSSE